MAVRPTSNVIRVTNFCVKVFLVMTLHVGLHSLVKKTRANIHYTNANQRRLSLLAEAGVQVEEM